MSMKAHEHMKLCNDNEPDLRSREVASSMFTRGYLSTCALCGKKLIYLAGSSFSRMKVQHLPREITKINSCPMLSDWNLKFKSQPPSEKTNNQLF